MRFKLLIVALVAALAVVSAAAGKGKPPKSGQGCKPAVKVVLKGVLAADVDPADGDTSFTMVVKHSNRFGRAWKLAGSATVQRRPEHEDPPQGRAQSRRPRSQRPPTRVGQGLQG